MPDAITGCARAPDGRHVPCVEIVPRLLAADRSERAGYVEVADRLRATAARIARVHLSELRAQGPQGLRSNAPAPRGSPRPDRVPGRPPAGSPPTPPRRGGGPR